MPTNWIAGGLFAGFIVFITIKGQLPAYKQAIFGGSAQNSRTSTATKIAQAIVGGPGQVASMLTAPSTTAAPSSTTATNVPQ